MIPANYCIETFSGFPSCILGKLQGIVNHRTPFGYRVKLREHIFFFIHAFLSFFYPDCLKLRLLVYLYKIIDAQSPSLSITRLQFSGSYRIPFILIPRLYDSLAERSSLVRVAKCWNALPLSLEFFDDSLNTFRQN